MASVVSPLDTSSAALHLELTRSTHGDLICCACMFQYMLMMLLMAVSLPYPLIRANLAASLSMRGVVLGCEMRCEQESAEDLCPCLQDVNVCFARAEPCQDCWWHLSQHVENYMCRLCSVLVPARRSGMGCEDLGLVYWQHNYCSPAVLVFDCRRTVPVFRYVLI